ncbi:MAG: hypothetical protein ABW007_00740 [Chitinophagaceae bacterium]
MNQRFLLLIVFCLVAHLIKAQPPGILWQRAYGSTDGDGPKAVRETADGGYIIAGVSYGNDNDVSGHHTTAVFSDAWIVKLNSAGAIIWQRSLGGGIGDH